MPPPISEAGPSKRVSHFHSDSGSEDDHDNLAHSRNRKISLVKRQKLIRDADGAGNKKKGNGMMKVQSGSVGNKERQRKERAEELFQTRQALPFYQGQSLLQDHGFIHKEIGGELTGG